MALITAESAPIVAQRFAALGEPTRLRLLATLYEDGEVAVGDLVDTVGSSYANVSRHLSVLYRERMVARRRDGTRTLYRIADPALMEICDRVCAAIRDELEQTARRVQGGGSA